MHFPLYCLIGFSTVATAAANTDPNGPLLSLVNVESGTFAMLETLCSLPDLKTAMKERFESISKTQNVPRDTYLNNGKTALRQKLSKLFSTKTNEMLIGLVPYLNYDPTLSLDRWMYSCPQHDNETRESIAKEQTRALDMAKRLKNTAFVFQDQLHQQLLMASYEVQVVKFLKSGEWKNFLPEVKTKLKEFPPIYPINSLSSETSTLAVKLHGLFQRFPILKRPQGIKHLPTSMFADTIFEKAFPSNRKVDSVKDGFTRVLNVFSNSSRWQLEIYDRISSDLKDEFRKEYFELKKAIAEGKVTMSQEGENMNWKLGEDEILMRAWYQFLKSKLPSIMTKNIAESQMLQPSTMAEIITKVATDYADDIVKSQQMACKNGKDQMEELPILLLLHFEGNKSIERITDLDVFCNGRWSLTNRSAFISATKAVGIGGFAAGYLLSQPLVMQSGASLFAISQLAEGLAQIQTNIIESAITNPSPGKRLLGNSMAAIDILTSPMIVLWAVNLAGMDVIVKKQGHKFIYIFADWNNPVNRQATAMAFGWAVMGYGIVGYTLHTKGTNPFTSSFFYTDVIVKFVRGLFLRQLLISSAPFPKKWGIFFLCVAVTTLFFQNFEYLLRGKQIDPASFEVSMDWNVGIVPFLSFIVGFGHTVIWSVLGGILLSESLCYILVSVLMLTPLFVLYSNSAYETLGTADSKGFFQTFYDNLQNPVEKMNITRIPKLNKPGIEKLEDVEFVELGSEEAADLKFIIMELFPKDDVGLASIVKVLATVESEVRKHSGFYAESPSQVGKLEKSAELAE